jgi:hypothetical protein
MRAFQVEYRAIAGFHDGVCARVLDSATLSPLVSLHEAMHGRIFRETPDGQIHAGYCLAVEHRLLSGPALEAATQSSQRFFESARLPHESFATYLSIKSLPAAEESTQLQQLTPEYIEYFKLLSECIDGVFPTSHLQFLIAWNFAAAIFSSPLLERFDTLDVNLPVDLLPDESPHHRFDLLLRQFVRADRWHLRQKLEIAAREMCAQSGLRYWDIFSENAWMEALYFDGRISEAPVLLEMKLSKLLQDWLRSTVSFTVLQGPRLAAAFARYAASLHTKLNLQPCIAVSQDSDQRRIQSDIIRTAASESQSRIINSGFYSPHRLDDLPGRTEELLRKLSAISIYSDCPPGRNLTHWSILGWARQATDAREAPEFLPELLARFRSSDVLSFLTEWMDRRARGVAVPELRAIIVAIRGPAEYEQLLEKLRPILDVDVDLYSRLCWYCWGGFMEMHQALANSRGPLFFGDLYEESYRELLNRNALDALSYNGLVIKVLQVGEKTRRGLFMKALPMQSAASLSSSQDVWVQTGVIEPASHEMLDKLVPLTSEVIEVARTFWREY